ncbi:sensor histidine kinase [Marinobacter koreensis]|uniref:sensor histidine kinase n=1 Tax=Marinobacter koreensis TaxID=335974 RepID=UPI00361AABE4
MTTPLPRLDWSLRVMVSTARVLWTRIAFVIGGLALYLAILLAWLYVRERYRREAELAQRGEQLEQSVAERTADLERSNRQLREEVSERERAQQELRETQQELIQAAKLAVLGQMSAGLNHEMNQPLTAIQTYARNSRRFLQKGAPDMVDANLAEIITLCDKMAELTRQFKVFARKSEGPPTSVDVRLAVDAALKIVSAQRGEGTPGYAGTVRRAPSCATET